MIKFIKRLGIFLVIVFLIFFVWSLAIQSYGASLVSFKNFEDEDAVETYFEDLWISNQTTKSQIELSLKTLGIQNCEEVYIPNKLHLHCVVSAPDLQYEHVSTFNLIVYRYFIVYMYEIYIEFEDATFKEIDVYYRNTFMNGYF